MRLDYWGSDSNKTHKMQNLGQGKKVRNHKEVGKMERMELQ
jgi:hypothetical protein